jgi:hypothetical protein
VSWRSAAKTGEAVIHRPAQSSSPRTPVSILHVFMLPVSLCRWNNPAVLLFVGIPVYCLSLHFQKQDAFFTKFIATKPVSFR